MIQSITIENFKGDSLECVLSNPFGHGLNITSISGLGPGNTNVVTQDLALLDGSVYTSTRRPQRNIVFTFDFIESEDIEEVRHRATDLFGLGRYVKLTFYTDHRTLWIDGFVESNEPDIFSQDEGTQVSIICPDPWFRSQSVIKTDILDYTDTNPWGFEFTMDYGREKDNMIEFAQVSEAKQYQGRNKYGNLPREYRVYNPGDRDMGFILTLTARSPERYYTDFSGIADGLMYDWDNNNVFYHKVYEPSQYKVPYAGLTHFYIANETNGEIAHICLPKNMEFCEYESYVFRSIPGYKMAYMMKFKEYKLDSQNVPTGELGYVPALSEFDRRLDWVKLQKGENILSVTPYYIINYTPGEYQTGGMDMSTHFDINIQYDPLYEGV